MALGTITLPTGADQVLGQPGTPLYVIPLQFAGDDAYATGGTANFTAAVRAAVGVKPKAVSVVAVIPGDCGATYLPYYDAAADKLVVRATANGAEASNSADLSGTTFKLFVVCR